MSKSTPLSQIPSSQNDMEDPLVQEVLAEIAQGSEQQQYIPQMTPTQMYNGSPNVAPKEFITPSPVYNQYQQGNQQAYSNRFNFDQDLKLILVVVAIVFAVQVLPIEQIVYKYLSVQNIPYSSFAIKAIAAGGLFYIAKKYFI